MRTCLQKLFGSNLKCSLALVSVSRIVCLALARVFAGGTRVGWTFRVDRQVTGMRVELDASASCIVRRMFSRHRPRRDRPILQVVDWTAFRGVSSSCLARFLPRFGCCNVKWFLRRTIELILRRSSDLKNHSSHANIRAGVLIDHFDRSASLAYTSYELIGPASHAKVDLLCCD